ncbi:MAG: type VI secretion system accessory protein TagJ [Chloroflexota bacterium]
MDAKELIRAGRLSEAREQLTSEVRAAPSDMAKRTVLFQVLAFLGEWDKAERHLDAMAAQSPGAETGVQVYRNLIGAERARAEVMELKRRPSFLPSAPTYAEAHFAGYAKLLGQKHDEALVLFEQVESQRPDVAGTLNGREFDGMYDIDALLSGFLEAVVHERYVWLPLEGIEEVSIPMPKSLLDVLWAPARVTTWEGLTMSCYLPVLYPGSSGHPDERVKLGRMTEWVDLGRGFTRGIGQHIFQAGDDEVALLEIREILFRKPEAGEAQESRA